MKKMLTVIMIVACMLAMVGCGSSDEESGVQTEEESSSGSMFDVLETD